MINSRALKQLGIAFAAIWAAAGSAAAPRPLVPVFTVDFPDPFILPHGDGFLAYATNASKPRANIQMAHSRDLVTWRLLRGQSGQRDALPDLPDWAAPGFTWAPEVMRIGGRYVMYFTVRERASDLQCVGAATAADPLGPFVPAGDGPLVCQRELGGSIDPSPFRDADGSLYLYYKNDGNNPRALKPSQIFAQRLSADGLSLTGPPKPLIRNELQWEWRVVEAPTMVRTPAGRYVLLFSANHFGWEADQRLSSYAMGYATCAGPAGPCTKAPENPVLSSYNDAGRGCLSGPGHQTVFNADQRQYLVFHAWSATARCRPANKARYMYIAPLEWREGQPVIGMSLRQTRRRR